MTAETIYGVLCQRVRILVTFGFALLFLSRTGWAENELPSVETLRTKVLHRLEEIRTLKFWAAQRVNGRTVATHQIDFAGDRVRCVESRNGLPVELPVDPAPLLGGLYECRQIVTPNAHYIYEPYPLETGNHNRARVVLRSETPSSESRLIPDWRLMGTLPVTPDTLASYSHNDLLLLPDATETRLEGVTLENGRRAILCESRNGESGDMLRTWVVPEWNHFIPRVELCSATGGCLTVRARSSAPNAAGLRFPEWVSFEVRDGDERISLEEWKLGQIQINPEFAEDHFSIARLGLPIDSMVSVASGIRDESPEEYIWTGKELIPATSRPPAATPSRPTSWRYLRIAVACAGFGIVLGAGAWRVAKGSVSPPHPSV